MKHSNCENAATVAKCFGKPDNLKVFRSLEALELDVFGPGISQALSGEAIPPHTCEAGHDDVPKQNPSALEFSTEHPNRNGLLQTSTLNTAERSVTVEALRAHLHRYRVVLIDDHYCGPVVSAFGLPRLLEFVRTHTW